MSRKERGVAALLLAIAVVGVALLPRLLSAPAASLGVAIGPGPSRSVVVAPAIPRTPRKAAPPRRVTRSAEASAAPVAPAKRISLRPAHKPREVPTKKVSPPPPPPPPPTTTTPAPPPPPSFQPPPTPPSPTASISTRPGHGYGDKNHVHTGPPGHDPAAEHRPSAAPPAHPTPPQVKPGQRSHGHDVPGSTHGRPLPQVPPHPVGARNRHVGRVAKAPARPAPPAAQARPKARPQAGLPRGEGSPAAPPLAHGPKGKHS
jgi:hypothetical protein